MSVARASLVWSAAAAVGLSLATVSPGQVAMKEVPPPARGLDVIEKPGQRLPMDLVFTDDRGRSVTLGEYFGSGKPAVLALGYYGCPTVCAVTLAKLTSAFNGVDYTIGRDFTALFVSIKPEETPEIAAESKKAQLAAYARGGEAGVREGWGFLTGAEGQTRALADGIGWQYRRLENGEYAHPICFVVLTPDGRVSRYKYGFSDDPRELKLMLLEASNGSIASWSLGDRFLHFCYRWDPNSNSYSLAAFRVMQAGGLLSMVGVGALIAVLRLRETVKREGRGAGAGEVVRAGLIGPDGRVHAAG